jgi:hypothetical protein
MDPNRRSSPGTAPLRSRLCMWLKTGKPILSRDREGAVVTNFG